MAKATNKTKDVPLLTTIHEKSNLSNESSRENLTHLDKSVSAHIFDSEIDTYDFKEYFPFLCNKIHCIIPIVKIVEPHDIEPDLNFELLLNNNPESTKHGIPSKNVKQVSEKDGTNENNAIVYIFYEDAAKLENLTTIIFRNFHVSDRMLEALKHILQFYTTVTVLKFQNCLLGEMEIKKISDIISSYLNITELNLDFNPVTKENFFEVLECKNDLHFLSLRFCQISDEGLNMLCNQLNICKSPLIGINLSSNNITDEGAKCLANMLRLNRSLASINLANNYISDYGCLSIFHVLQHFPLTLEETLIKRQKNMAKLIKQIEMSKEKLMMARISPTTKPNRKSSSYARSVRQASLTSIKTKPKTLSVKGMSPAETSTNKSLNEPKKIFEHFSNQENIEQYHPFFNDYLQENGKIYCFGNFQVAHLNLSYNKITNDGFKYIQSVVNFQIRFIQGKKGASLGLLYVVLNGNAITVANYIYDLNFLLKTKRVFVYGTLKKGEPNHHWLTNEKNGYAKFTCEAETIEKYPLVIGTKYNIPFLLYQSGTGHNVKGEIYEINEQMLSNLDILEEHPSFYERNLYDVRIIPTGEKNSGIINCWIYFLKKFKPEMLQKQMFDKYNNDGSHGLKYLERYLREPNYDHRDEVV